MPLTDIAIGSAKPGGKPIKLSDGGGLQLLVMPTGSKLWNLAYRDLNRKQRKLSFGAYPAVTLAEACKRRDDAKALLASRIDPSQQKRLDKLTKATSAATTFRLVAEQYLDKQKREGKSEATITKNRYLLEKAFPDIGERPIAEITSRARRQKEGLDRCLGHSRGGLTTKLHALVDARGRPILINLTASQASDIASAKDLIGHLAPGSMLFADKGYDANELRAVVAERKAWVNIPPKCNRKDPICFSKHLYKARNLVKRFFNKIKQFRRVATRLDKTAENFFAAVKLASIKIWLRGNESTASHHASPFALVSKAEKRNVCLRSVNEQCGRPIT